uniref:RanBP2-type domain-containing protein n=1 Tax=Peronospora matthiolae TaxID=2874970 RepID=A0AAV1TC57_9STRA
MQTSLSSPTEPRDSKRDQKNERHRRREDKTPFTAYKRQKTDDSNALRHSRAPERGFFARVARYIPIVKQFMTGEDIEGEEVEDGDGVEQKVGGKTGEGEGLTTQEDFADEEESESDEGRGEAVVEGVEVMETTVSGGVEKEQEQKQEDESEMESQVEVEHDVERLQQQEMLEKVLDVSVSPVTRSTVLAGHVKERVPRRRSLTPNCRRSRSPSRESVKESGKFSLGISRSQQPRGEKRRRLFGFSQPSKTLQFGSSQEQEQRSCSSQEQERRSSSLQEQERRSSSSQEQERRSSSSQEQERRSSSSQEQERRSYTSPLDSAQDVIKQKKTITLDEFERLQHQLHEMVETTPQEQLARTQAALANGLERPFTRGFPGATSFPGYVPGSSSAKNHGGQSERKRGLESVVESRVPFCKRPKTHENGSLAFSGTSLCGVLTREERRLRKPRPSSLLPKRDASASKMYSDALVGKILSVLDKVQTQEAQKPAPSTTASWAKYHPARTGTKTTTFDKSLAIGSDDVPPPTATVPRVAFPQSCEERASSPSGVASKSAPDQSSKSAIVKSNAVASLFSPQVVSVTPAPATTRTFPERQLTETIGGFEFTLPLHIEGVKLAEADDEGTRVRFVFSPPPSLRKPPVKVSNQKNTQDANVAIPLALVPEAKATERVSNPSQVERLDKSKAVAEKPVAAAEVTKPSTDTAAATPAASPSGTVNPLARFMQLKPGQWKCPGCSVLNEAASAKCPCCETAKPDGGAAEKACTAKACTALPKAIENRTSSGFGFGQATEATAVAQKGAAKPVAGKITPSGFSFGVQDASSKTGTVAPTGSITPNGFSFGAPVASAVQEAGKPTFDATPVEYTFTTPAAVSGTQNTVDFNFGTAAVPVTKVEASGSTAAIKFVFSAPPTKTDGTLSNPFADTGKAATISSFSLGVPTASTSGSNKTLDPPSYSGGFAFGTTSASMAESRSKGGFETPVIELLPKESALAFGFGVAKTDGTEASTPKPVPAFSFAAAPKPTQASPKEFDRPTKQPAGLFGASDLKSKAPAFSFGAVSAPSQVSVEEFATAPSSTPSFKFGGSTTAELKEAESSAMDLGSSSTEVATVALDEKSKESMPAKMSFAFGSSTAATTPATGFESNTGSKSTTGFSFNATAASPASASSALPSSATAPASAGFTFGQTPTMRASSSAPASRTASQAFDSGSSKPATPLAGTSTSQTASAPAFTFGSSSAKPVVSSAFGQAPAMSFNTASSAEPAGSTAFGGAPSPTGFGTTLSAFGSSSSGGVNSGPTVGGFGSSSTAAPSTPFGSSTSSFKAAAPFSFGGSSQPQAASAPTNIQQPAFSFGASSAPASNGFVPGGSSGGFGTTFGAPKAGSGFGNGPSSSGYRPPTPTSGFGFTPAAPAFGNVPSTAFGATAPASGFGAPAAGAFGASGDGTSSMDVGSSSAAPAFGAVPSGAFGATTPASGFGAPAAGVFGAPADGRFGMGAGSAPTAPAFGTVQNAAFGTTAPASGFGAPTAGAFTAPSDGTFSMGVAPQHAKGRRILKAKSRKRRTS